MKPFVLFATTSTTPTSTFYCLAVILLAISLASIQVQGAKRHRYLMTLMDLHSKKGRESSTRIISGERAEKGQFPYQVALQMIRADGAQVFCGGSLIDPQWILTAAHCTNGMTQFKVILGTTDVRTYDEGHYAVQSYERFQHPGYNPMNLRNDISLLRLTKRVDLSPNIQTIALPKRSQANIPIDGGNVTASGWGRTSDNSQYISSTLQFVGLSAITNEECEKVYTKEIITSANICTVGHPDHSVCNGDSGGPLVIYNEDQTRTLLGIASFVHSKGCSSGNPAGFVRVTSYLDYIGNITGIPIQD